eukprot:3031776-Rhodomonas_salina.1
MADAGQHTLTQMWPRRIEGASEPDNTGESAVHLLPPQEDWANEVSCSIASTIRSMEFALTIVIDCETATDLMYFCARLRSSLPPYYVPPTQGEEQTAGDLISDNEERLLMLKAPDDDDNDDAGLLLGVHWSSVHVGRRTRQLVEGGVTSWGQDCTGMKKLS